MVVVAIIIKSDRVLVSTRQENCRYAGLLEFPGGKVEPKETQAAALVRECQEELGITPINFTLYDQQKGSYNEYPFELIFYHVDKFSGQPHGCEGQIIQWLPIHTLRTKDFLPANGPILNKIKEDFSHLSTQTLAIE